MTLLRKAMLEELQRRNFSPTTVRIYLRIVDEFAQYSKRSPDRLGPEHIRQYQAHLFTDRKLGAISVTQHLSALRFFFLNTLKRPWVVADMPSPKRPFRLPEVLAPEEVERLIQSAASSLHRIWLLTLYATGMRREELVQLKVDDIDSGRMVIHVRQGKGRKDRDIMLSPRLLQELRAYWRSANPKPKTHVFPGKGSNLVNSMRCPPLPRTPVRSSSLDHSSWRRVAPLRATESSAFWVTLVSSMSSRDQTVGAGTASIVNGPVTRALPVSGIG